MFPCSIYSTDRLALRLAAEWNSALQKESRRKDSVTPWPVGQPALPSGQGTGCASVVGLPCLKSKNGCEASFTAQTRTWTWWCWTRLIRQSCRRTATAWRRWPGRRNAWTAGRCGPRVGVPGLDPHDLRRDYAQLGFDSGIPITQISALLGHESVKTTQTYLNLSLDLETTASDFIPLSGD